MPRCKSFITEFLQSSNIHTNLLIIDFDNKEDNIILNNDFEYNKIINIISNNQNDLLLPIQYRCIEKLKRDFMEKSIVIISSNVNLAEYTKSRIPCEINVFIPSPKYYEMLMINIIDDDNKKRFFNDYNNIVLSKNKYEIYTSLEDIREKIKHLFL